MALGAGLWVEDFWWLLHGDDLGMLQTILKQIYPDQCPACDELVQNTHALCPTCWRDSPFIQAPFCNHCGVQLPGVEEDGAPDLVCDDCMAELPTWDRGRAAFMYDGAARRMVLGLKHGDRHDLVPVLAGWAAEAVDALVTDDTVFVPVPLHFFRLYKRRYNQSALISSELAKITGRRACLNALKRKRFTPSLDGKTCAERQAILSGAIKPNPRKNMSIAHKDVILVDDVMTTGATLTSCTSAIRAMDARRVDVLTLARVGKAP
ncbi:MAG: ComF family protein [Planktomarina sp.]